jgi:hypothetical protein
MSLAVFRQEAEVVKAAHSTLIGRLERFYGV